MGVRILGIGRGLPGDNVSGRIVTNAELETAFQEKKRALIASGDLLPPERWDDLDDAQRTRAEKRWEQLDMSAAWLVEKTGIKERRFADSSVCTSDLAVAAIRDCCTNAHVDPTSLGGIDLATVSPDYPYTPPTVTQIALKLGIPPANPDGSLRQLYGDDTALACTSFLVALRHAHDALVARHFDVGVAVGADTMTTTFDENDRALAGILADGAGALLLGWTDDPQEASFFGPKSFHGGMDGSRADLIIAPKGGSKRPLGTGDLTTPWDHGRYITMKGPLVRRAAEQIILKFVPATLAKAGLTLADIRFVALHQANLNINEPIERKLREAGFRGALLHNIDRFGNTTSASVPLVLWDAWQRGILRYGDFVLLLAFGGGLTWASAILRWTVPDRIPSSS